ncbi:Flavoprotein [Trinorchestia longiramus]|nr:Flavoprotein [Trinorchestia longiramus]
MGSMTLGTRSFQPTPPDKGSFPLDHEGECKAFMVKYMECMHENKGSNSECRIAARDYLDCRMQKGLMAKEDLYRNKEAIMASERLIKWMSEVEDTVTKEKKRSDSDIGTGVGARAPRVLLGCSGSVATIKVPLVVAALERLGVRVVVLPTKPALHFLVAAAPKQQDVSCEQAGDPAPKLDEVKTKENQKLKSPLLQSTHELLAQSNQDIQCKNDHYSGCKQGVICTKDEKELASTTLPKREDIAYDSTSFSGECFKCSWLFHSHKKGIGPETSQGSQNCCPTNDKILEMNSSNLSSSRAFGGKYSRMCEWCQVQQLYPELNIVGDEMEWRAWRGRGDPVLHIQLRRWADLLVIAPLSANTLAKLACGLCDNLLTCVARAWDPQKPLLFCPAMNTFMYDHPFTAQHVHKLKELGYIEVAAVSKRLMCGDVGGGAMAEVQDIVAVIRGALLKRGFDLALNDS